jgi:hypothetical protein
MLCCLLFEVPQGGTTTPLYSILPFNPKYDEGLDALAKASAAPGATTDEKESTMRGIVRKSLGTEDSDYNSRSA